MGPGFMSLLIARREARAMTPQPLIAERDRIAHALQRVTIHRLFGIGLRLQALSLRSADSSVSEHLDECVRELDLAIADVRGVVFDEVSRDVGRATAPT